MHRNTHTIQVPLGLLDQSSLSLQSDPQQFSCFAPRVSYCGCPTFAGWARWQHLVTGILLCRKNGNWSLTSFTVSNPSIPPHPCTLQKIKILCTSEMCCILISLLIHAWGGKWVDGGTVGTIFYKELGIPYSRILVLRWGPANNHTYTLVVTKG